MTCPIWLKRVTTLADVTRNCRSLPPLPFSTLIGSVRTHKIACIPWQFYTTRSLVLRSSVFAPRSVCVAYSQRYLKSRKVRALSVYSHACTIKVFGQAMGCVLWDAQSPTPQFSSCLGLVSVSTDELHGVPLWRPSGAPPPSGDSTWEPVSSRQRRHSLSPMPLDGRIAW